MRTRLCSYCRRPPTFVIPYDPSFTGLPVVSQSYAYTLPLTTLGLIASNGVVMVVGPQ